MLGRRAHGVKRHLVESQEFRGNQDPNGAEGRQQLQHNAKCLGRVVHKASNASHKVSVYHSVSQFEMQSPCSTAMMEVCVWRNEK